MIYENSINYAYFCAYIFADAVCVANIFPQQRLDQLTKLKRLMIVALIPFYGYYYVCNLERESV